jgi:mycothiol system anti-sigma-R factor
MNDSRGNSIDCQAAFESLYDYLDGELDADATAAIKAHLEMCAQCFSVFDFEKTFLMFVEARSQAQGAPDSVKKKLLEALLTEGPEETNQ